METKKRHLPKWKSIIRRRFPIVKMLSAGYTLSDALTDALAGFTVALCVIPQSIAMAIIAELPPHYGLYSSFIGSFVYIFLGSVPAVTVGPTTLMSIMTQKGSSIHPGYAPFMSFCNGIIILTCGIFRLGFLVDFVSSPVISGFTSAASVTITVSQMKNLLGLAVREKSHLPAILKTLQELFDNIHTIKWMDALLGVICITSLLVMNALPKLKWIERIQDSRYRKWTKQTFWILSISRNAIVVLASATLAYFLSESKEKSTFTLSGDIMGGLPTFDWPMFGINRTETVENPSVGEVLASMNSVLLTLPLIATLSQIAIAKAFSHGKLVDATQEFIALGAANLAGSFFHSMPVAASFGRTAVNSASSARTTLGGIVTGTVVLLALAFLMPHCAFIPRTTLASVIICAVIFSIEYHVVIPMWKSKKMDLVPATVTFIGCLFWSLEYGIIVGIVTNLLIILHHSARPKVTSNITEWDFEGKEHIWITLDHGWSFPATSHIRNCIDKIMLTHKNVSNLTVIVDFSNVDFIDYSSAHAIRDLVSHYEKLGHNFVLFNFRNSLKPTLIHADAKQMDLVFADQMSDLTPLISKN